MPPARNGRDRRPRDPVRSRDAILRAAQRQFASHGYERTTIRGVAAEAEIDPTMVIRYYGSKEDLFAAAVRVDLRLPDFSAVGRDDLGRAMVAHFLRRWEGDLADDVLQVLLRSAATHPAAAIRLRGLFAEQVTAAMAGVVPDHAEERAALVASQLLGLAFGRYVLALPGLTEPTEKTLTARFAGTVQRYLTDPLPD